MALIKKIKATVTIDYIFGNDEHGSYYETVITAPQGFENKQIVVYHKKERFYTWKKDQESIPKKLHDWLFNTTDNQADKLSDSSNDISNITKPVVRQSWFKSLYLVKKFFKIFNK